MNYDDDELAEAALLLAHVDEGSPMPRALERTIIHDGRAIAATVRFTTTKAAAVTVLAASEPARARASGVRAWAGWLAVAACVAVLVYQWRVRELESALASRPLPAAANVELSDERGSIANVRWDEARRAGQIVITRLAANEHDERYVLWVSTSDVAHAIAIGSFMCESECRARAFSLHGADTAGRVKAAWLTRGTSAQAPADAPTLVVGSGHTDVDETRRRE